MRGCEDLFEALQVSLGLPYISDLKDMSRARRKQLGLALQFEDLKDYPLEQWNEAIQYITGQPQPQQNIQDAVECLMRYTQR